MPLNGIQIKLRLSFNEFIMQHKELTNEDLMELEAQRNDEERQEEEEVTEEPEIHDAGNGKGMFFICRGTVGF